MKSTMGVSLAMAVALVAGMGAAQAETLLGRLELGSPETDKTVRPGAFTVRLLADDGRRYMLDAKQALRAADNLQALSSRRVAVELSDANLYAPTRMREIEAIVLADPSDPSASGRTSPLAAKLVPDYPAGNTRWLTIACKFNDVADEPRSIAFFNNQYAVLDQYWQEVSYKKINLYGSTAIGWFVLPHPRAYYMGVDEGWEYVKPDLLYPDCLAAAGSQVDVENLYAISMVFNSELGDPLLESYDYGQRTCVLHDLQYGRCILPGTLNPPSVYNNLGHLAHQMGHAYGLRETGNSDNDGDSHDNPWTVMSDFTRHSLVDASFGPLPKHLNMEERSVLGWVDPARKLEVQPHTSISRVVLDRASLMGSTNVQMIILNRSGWPIIVEARKRKGLFESQLAGDAVILHTTKNTSFDTWDLISIDSDNPPATVSDNEGSMLKVGESWTSPDGLQRITVVSETAQGFVLSIGKGRVTGGASQPRVRVATSTPVQQATTSSNQAGSRPGRERDRRVDAGTKARD